MRRTADHLSALLFHPLSDRSPDARSTDLGLLALRLAFGLSMALTHGRATLDDFLTDPTGFPDPLGLGPELSTGLMAFAELLCALAVAAGLLTRVAAVPLVFGMGTAFFVFHAADPFGHKELAFLYLSAFTAVLLAGPGRYSLDALIVRWRESRRGRRGGARSAAAAVGLAIVLAGGLLAAAPLAAESRIEGDLPRKGDRPLEAIPGVDSVYGVLETSDGVRLRTVLTRPPRTRTSTPEGPEARLPAILFVQWLSCDTVELPASRQSGWSRMLRRVATESGLVMLRTEKAGVGDSEGPPCSELGYDRELAHHRDALDLLRRTPGVDPERIVVFGASMGATMAPLVAVGQDVAGVVIWGGGAVTWLERLLAFERNRRELTGVPAVELTAEMKRLSAFLPEYLVHRRHPREIAAEDPALGKAWELVTGAEGDTHYGRPVAFHQEAQARDWAAAWAEVDVPTLVLYGEYDWFETERAHRSIVHLVNRNGSAEGGGLARLEVIEATDHHFERYPSPQAAAEGRGGAVAEGPAVEAILAWLREVVR